MKSETGNREWLNEFGALQKVSPENPFAVPEGYFDELEQRIISQKNVDEMFSKVPEGLTVPINYFDELSANIQSRLNIEAFVNNNEHGYAVPENYFDELSAGIQSRINIEAFAGSDEHGLTVPEHYFDELQQNINSRVLIEEALPAGESFAVPDGYFDKLNKAIINQTIDQDMVRRKGVVRKMFATGAFKYAAAASVALIIGTGIFISQVNVTNTGNAHNSSSLHKQLSSLPLSDIQSYLQDDVDANETQHAVIDEGAPVNDADLSNALKSYINSTNNE